MHWNSVNIVNKPMEVCLSTCAHAPSLPQPLANCAAIQVVNVITEPESTSQRFIVYGARLTDKGKLEGVLVYVSFANLHERACRGANNTGNSDSDYEHWTPTRSAGHMLSACATSIFVYTSFFIPLHLYVFFSRRQSQQQAVLHGTPGGCMHAPFAHHPKLSCIHKPYSPHTQVPARLTRLT